MLFSELALPVSSLETSATSASIKERRHSSSAEVNVLQLYPEKSTKRTEEVEQGLDLDGHRSAVTRFTVVLPMLLKDV